MELAGWLKVFEIAGIGGAFIIQSYILFWMVRSRQADFATWSARLITLNEQTNEIVAENTKAIQRHADSIDRLLDQLEEHRDLVQSLNVKMAARPCLAEGKGRSPSS